MPFSFSPSRIFNVRFIWIFFIYLCLHTACIRNVLNLTLSFLKLSIWVLNIRGISKVEIEELRLIKVLSYWVRPSSWSWNCSYFCNEDCEDCSFLFAIFLKVVIVCTKTLQTRTEHQENILIKNLCWKDKFKCKRKKIFSKWKRLEAAFLPFYVAAREIFIFLLYLTSLVVICTSPVWLRCFSKWTLREDFNL